MTTYIAGPMTGLKKFKFKFSYITQGLDMKGDGHVIAEDAEAAIAVAKNGVAEQMGGKVENVNILSVTAVRAKKVAK